MADEKNLDRTFAETQNIEVYARHEMFRYRKKYKKELTANGRKQGRFHQKDKDRTAGIRRD
jgi:hypothetical protein